MLDAHVSRFSDPFQLDGELVVRGLAIWVPEYRGYQARYVVSDLEEAPSPTAHDLIWSFDDPIFSTPGEALDAGLARGLEVFGMMTNMLEATTPVPVA